jgi:hypothetical protein
MGKTFSDMIGNLETVIARIQNAGIKKRSCVDPQGLILLASTQSKDLV